MNVYCDLLPLDFEFLKEFFLWCALNPCLLKDIKMVTFGCEWKSRYCLPCLALAAVLLLPQLVMPPPLLHSISSRQQEGAHTHPWLCSIPFPSRSLFPFAHSVTRICLSFIPFPPSFRNLPLFRKSFSLGKVPLNSTSRGSTLLWET